MLHCTDELGRIYYTRCCLHNYTAALHNTQQSVFLTSNGLFSECLVLSLITMLMNIHAVFRLNRVIVGVMTGSLVYAQLKSLDSITFAEQGSTTH